MHKLANVFRGRIGKVEVVKPSQLPKSIIHFIFINLELVSKQSCFLIHMDF